MRDHIKGNRRPDFVEYISRSVGGKKAKVTGAKIHEVKSGDGPFSARDKEQLADFLVLADKDNPASIDGAPLKGVVLTLTSPKGARRNAKFLVNTLQDNPQLTVRVFNSAGRSFSFDARQLDAMKHHLGLR